MGVSGFFSISTNHLGNFDRGDYTVREDVTLQRDAHELHVGGEAVRVSNNLVNTFTMSGQFGFSNQLTGNNLSDFMLGDASSFLQGGGEFKNLYGTLWSGFVQDNWRVNPRLHLDSACAWIRISPTPNPRGEWSVSSPARNRKSSRTRLSGVLYGGSAPIRVARPNRLQGQ